MAEKNKTLSTEQLAEVLRLLRGADSVELKLSVPDADHRSAIAALDLDPLDAQIRQVFFFDTPDLTLNTHGVVVRARRIQGKTGDSVVKLRPLVPDEIPRSVRGRGREPGLPRRPGIDLLAEQQTKTKTALSFFAAELTAASTDR